MNNPTSLTSTPNIILHNGHPVTTSLDVAERFGKRHDNVLRDIQRILETASKEFSQLNFEVADYLDAQEKPRPMYQITKDGFALLAMGFPTAKTHNLNLCIPNHQPIRR